VGSAATLIDLTPTKAGWVVEPIYLNCNRSAPASRNIPVAGTVAARQEWVCPSAGDQAPRARSNCCCTANKRTDNMAGRNGEMDAAANRLGARDDAQVLCKRTWWVFQIGGIASVVFGVFAYLQPGIALLVLSMFFAASILVDGVMNAVGALRNQQKDGWWIMLLIGVLGLLVGGYALFNPPLSMLAFIYLFAFEAIALGVFLVMLGYKVRQATTREWILYLCGALSILVGVLVVAQPVAGGLSIVWLIAGWSVVVGILRIVFAYRIRSAPELLQARRAR
jgi:uncharacterized membrane protein HdeD (DUF308 family)